MVTTQKIKTASIAQRRCDLRRNGSLSSNVIISSAYNVFFIVLLLTTTNIYHQISTTASSTTDHDSGATGGDNNCALNNDGVCHDDITSSSSTSTPNDDIPPAPPPCHDDHELCEFWKDHGECDANPDYMLTHCQKSCNVCLSTFDKGVDQIADDPHRHESTVAVITDSETYLRRTILRDPRYAAVRDRCKNNHALCSFWAASDECETNPTFMKSDCALACRSCEFLDYELRCPMDPTAVDALRPGDLNRLFERISDGSEGSEYATYEPVIHSRPFDGNLPPSTDDDGNRSYKEGPWVVTFENFLTNEECDHLIALGGEKGYKRSTNVGQLNDDGSSRNDVAESRTSENAWCDNDCYNDPIQQNIINRIATITSIPESHQEHLQLLRYTTGQFYSFHHDYIHRQRFRQPGPRILTFFLYLNDVERGGGTQFSSLGLTIMPKKGKALIWPSVVDENPNEMEPLTFHEALVVEKGVKYGANAWIHLRDAKTPHKNNCQ